MEDALKSKFDDDMQNGNICMLRNWHTYKSTLPVREVDNTALPLFELLYFGKEADVQTLGRLLATGARDDEPPCGSLLDGSRGIWKDQQCFASVSHK